MPVHFIITRFNLVKKDWLTDKNDIPVLDEEWLIKRISLFENFCLPTVLSQSQKSFKWLIFFQKGSEKELSSLLDRLQSYDFIEPVFIDDYAHFQSSISQFVTSKIPNKSTVVITTRLDNDDAIHPDFVSEIQKKRVNIVESCTILDFPKGLSLELHPKPKVAIFSNPLNPFLSLIEKFEPNTVLKTVFFRTHNDWADFQQISIICKDPMWIEIVHDSNKMNCLNGRLTSRKKLRGFAIRKISFSPFYFWDRIYYDHFKNKEYSGKYFLKRMNLNLFRSK